MTARFKEHPNYEKTNLPGKCSNQGQPDIKTTVRTSGEVTELLEESSLLYQIVSGITRGRPLCLKGEVQPMFPTASGKIVAAKSIAVMQDGVALVDPKKLEQMYEDIAGEKKVYPKSIEFYWPRSAEVFSPSWSVASGAVVSRETFFGGAPTDTQQCNENAAPNALPNP
jgi:hypothetical protein